MFPIKRKDSYQISDKTLNLLLEKASIGVFIYDAGKSQEFLYLSKGLLKILGYSQNEFSFKFKNRFDLLIYTEDRQRILSEIKEQTRVSKSCTCEYRVEDAKNKMHWFIHQGCHMIDDLGNNVFYVVVSDVTANHENELLKKKTEETLEKMFRDAVKKRNVNDSNLIAFMEFDITDDCMLYNDSTDLKFYSRDCKINASEVVKKGVAKVLGEKDQKLFKESLDLKNLRKVAKEKGRIFLEYHRRYTDDRIRLLNTIVEFILDLRTMHYLAFAYTYDVTEEKEIFMMFNQLVQKQNECVVKFDKNSRFCTIFAKKNNALGFPEGVSFSPFNKIEQKIGNTEYYRKINEDGINHCDDIFTFYEVGKTYSCVGDFKAKNGQKHFLRNNVFVNDDQESAIFYIDNINDVFLKELQMKATLEKALKETEKANAAKSDFLSRMSHEMRTPMNAVLAYSNFGIDECPEKKCSKYFKKINSSGYYLLALLNDVLDMQKLESGQVHLRKDVVGEKEFLDNILSVILPLVKQKGLVLKTDFSTLNNYYCLCDKMRMQQIVLNILNNAIKYTPAGGEVYWSVEILHNKEGDFARYTIRDTGIGISAEFQKKMYDPFVQESNEIIKEQGGAGLGLAITKSIVKKMGGSINCQSELDKGTTFEIIVPIILATEEQVKEHQKNVNTKSNYLYQKKSEFLFLLCEDNKINVEIICKMLEPQNIKIDLATNGKIGVAKAKEKEYDLIMMDIRMPEMDGLTATKEIRMFNPDIPIIALSANAYEEDKKKSLDAGMNAHLAKPIDKNELYTILNLLLLRK